MKSLAIILLLSSVSNSIDANDIKGSTLAELLKPKPVPVAPAVPVVSVHETQTSEILKVVNDIKATGTSAMENNQHVMGHQLHELNLTVSKQSNEIQAQIKLLFEKVENIQIAMDKKIQKLT